MGDRVVVEGHRPGERAGDAERLRSGFLVPLAVRVAFVLAGLRTVEQHDLLPGSAQPLISRPASPANQRILARARALLAKAESTTFEAEAETFTAGAQALMARHSI